MSKEIYVSTDIETDGPIPGPHSMLSLASAAFLADGMIDTFTVNLELLEGATGDPRTMEWWGSQPEAWEAARRDPKPVHQSMCDYVHWLKRLPGKPVFVGYPAGFDFTFVYWYLMKFAKKSPFSFSAIDMKTMAMVLMKCNFRDAVKRKMPKEWFSDRPHTHVALDDAIEQGELFISMLKCIRGE